MPATAGTESVPFCFNLDSISCEYTGGVSGTAIAVLQNTSLPRGESLALQGWLSTPEGVSSYEYALVPSGGGQALWKRADELNIYERPDLTNANIPHLSGHKTAGFSLALSFPADMADGYYDLYLRAIDGMGTPCDFLALIHLRYGVPDADDGKSRTVSLPLLKEEGPAALLGGATATDTAITLPAGAAIRLGEFYLPAFERIRIHYTVDKAPTSDTARPLLGIKSSGAHPYGAAGDRYNMTDDLAYSALPLGKTEGILELALSDLLYSGEVWLTGYLDATVTVTAVELTYKGYATDRTAAKIRFSGELFPAYFSGAQAVTVTGGRDPTLGDVMRIELTEDSNDPYIHFYAERLLADHEIKLTADEYKYMVLLARAMPENLHPHMTFYLCAGSITGATEACTYSTTLKTDGKWHYYLIDLTEKDTWQGIIHGWRFDIINGKAAAGDAVEFASVQFFRTATAATKAAAQNPADAAPYTAGEPAVLRDSVEEADICADTYTPAPSDTFVVTEAATEAPTEPETTAPVLPDTTPTATETSLTAPTEVPTEPALPPARRGCASSLCLLTPALTAPLALILRRRTTRRMPKA